MGSPQRRNLPKEEPMVYFGNWCGPGWSAGHKVLSAAQLSSADLSVGGRVVVGSTGVQRQSPVDLVCKVHDIAYQDIYNTTNYRLAMSKQLKADINLFSSVSQLIDQTNHNQMDLNLGELLFAKNVRISFAFKILIEAAGLGYAANTRSMPSSFLTPFQNQLKSEAIAAGGSVYGSFTDDFGGVTSFSYNAFGEASFKSLTFDSSITGYLSPTGNANLTFASLSGDGNMLSHASLTSFGTGNFSVDGTLRSYDAIGINDSGQAVATLPDGEQETISVRKGDGGLVTLAEVAQTFGSTLGRLIGGSDLIISTAAGSVLSAAALSIGKSFFGYAYHQAPGTVGSTAATGGTIWSDFQFELGQFGTSAAVGSVSSYLTTELAQAVGFKGFAGQAFSAVTGNALQFYATRAIAGSAIGKILGISASGSLGGTLASGIAGFIGTELASLVVTPHTIAEATLASLGSAIGAIGIGSLGSTIAAGIATSIAASGGSFSTVLAVSSLGGPVGVAIGAFVGFILGDLIGSLFGHHKPRVPSASAETVLEIPFAHFGLGAQVSANGGDLSFASAMAQAARDTLNGIIAQITHGQTATFVSNTYSPTQSYGFSGNQIYVKLAGQQTNVTSADQAVDKGVLWALPQTKIVGGDLYLKRAIANGQWTTVTAMLGDLQIASDYEQYLKNEPVIDAAISSSYHSLSAEDKAFYAANQAFMTRAISATELPLQGGDVDFYNGNRGQVERIVSSISVSSFAAGWITTLARAAELRLGQYSSSDFYGGLGGFLNSFGVAGTGTTNHYEDFNFSLHADGSASISTQGEGAAGVFSILPGTLGGSADNDVYNPHFQAGNSGWYALSSPGVWVDYGTDLPGWSGSGNDVIWSVMHGTPAPGNVVDWRGETMSAVAGHMYEESVRAAEHRGAAQLIIEFLDANQNVIATPLLGSGGRDYGSSQGDINSYDLLTGTAVAPAGTAFRRILLRNVSNGGNEPYAFFTRPESHDVTAATDLRNPRFLTGQEGWTLSTYDGPGARWGDNLNADWSGSGNDVLWVNIPGNPSNAFADIRSERMGAQAGADYDVSVLAAQHRTHVEVHVEWFDANGNWISSTRIPGNGRDAGGYKGDPANYNKIAGTITAPAGAVYRNLLLRTEGGQDAYGFFTQPVFEPATANEVSNPRFLNGQQGWNPLTWDAPGFGWGINLNGDWSGSGNDVLWTHIPGATASDSVADVRSSRMRSQGGEAYEVSVLAADHRGAVQLWVEWFDVNGNWITSTNIAGSGREYGGYRGNASEYNQIAATVIAPVGAAFSNLLLRTMGNSGNDVYGFFTHPTFKPVGTDNAAAWSSRPADYMAGGAANWEASGQTARIENFASAVGYNNGTYSAGNDVIDNHLASGDVSMDDASSVYEGGDDIFIGGSGNDTLNGQSGFDWLDGGTGNDYLIGGSGNDILLGRAGDDSIEGGDGADYLTGGDGNDTLDGGNGADVLVGGQGSDTLHGGSGDDTLIADEDGGTYDLLDGGNGSDTVSFERFTAGVTADISSQGPSNLITMLQAGFTLYRNQQISSPDGRYRFVFQGDENLVLYDGNTALWASGTRNGSGYRVTLNSDGNLVMYRSNNSIRWQSSSGGHSGATLTLDNAGQLNIDDQDGTAYWSVGGGGYVPPVNSFINGDQWTSIENITGSNYDDTLTGTNYGSVLKGLAGDDILTGGGGDDTLEGGAGADHLNGGGGTNTASYAASKSGVYVNLQTGTTIGGDATGDVLSNIQNLNGSAASDELAGDSNTNLIKAGSGDDWIDASAGSDNYDGGDGFDTVDYSATDFVSGSGEQVEYDEYGNPYYYQATVAAVSVAISSTGGSVSYRNADGSIGSQTLNSIEQVIGTSSDDSFSSAGSTFNVTWNGGAGADNFTGGDGSDAYVFGHGFGTYTISDTNAASNTLKLTSDVTFDDLWVGNASGTLQVGIRGEAGSMSVYSNFATAGNDVIKTLDLGGAGHVDLTQINAVYGGSDGDDSISAGSGTYNLIFAYNGNDTIYAANGQYSYTGSVIYGGVGNDTIITSVGDDQFLFERGNGHDYLIDGGGQNTVVLGSTVAADDVLYQIIGNDLFIGIKSLDDPNLTASQVADTIQIVGGAVKYVGSTYGTTYWNTGFSVEAGGATTDLTKANIAWVVQSYDDSDQGGGGGGGGGGDGGGGGGGGDFGGGGGGGAYIPPIVLDLGGDGLEITPVAKSSIVTQDSAGNVLRTSWVGPTNGMLAYDRNGDGRIDNTADISFTTDKPGAKTDLDGLAGWDTNADGVLDARDANFAKLVVWVDANQDGQQELGEVTSLLAAGVVSIDLKGKPTGFDGKDTIDTVVRNTTAFTRADGSTGTAYDVALARRALGDAEVSSTVGGKGLGGVAVIGKLANDPLADAKAKGLSGAALTTKLLNGLAKIEHGGKVKASIGAADAKRWASVLDSTVKAAHKALLASGMQGSDLLDAIRVTKAHGGDWTSLLARGLRTATMRMQALVVDFNRTGADLIDPTKSHALADIAHTGLPAQIGWVKSSDGILAYDADGNGQVDVANEIDLTGDVANARTVFQGLGAHDTDKDGAISAADTGFAKFLIWRDKNGNGRSDAGEVQTLAQAGVKQLDLKHATSHSAFGSAAANEVLGVSKITFTDGSTRSLYDVALGFADGDTTADPKPGKTPSASIASEVTPKSVSQQASGGNGTAASSAQAGVQLSGDLAGVSHRPAGLSGPQGAVVDASMTKGPSVEWWRDASVVGDELAALARPQPASETELGANRSSLINVNGSDAAQLQRLMLLRQNMAAMHGDAGGAAAIWNRGAANDTPLAAPSNGQALTSAVPKMAIAG